MAATRARGTGQPRHDLTGYTTSCATRGRGPGRSPALSGPGIAFSFFAPATRPRPRTARHGAAPHPPRLAGPGPAWPEALEPAGSALERRYPLNFCASRTCSPQESAD